MPANLWCMSSKEEGALGFENIISLLIFLFNKMHQSTVSCILVSLIEEIGAWKSGDDMAGLCFYLHSFHPRTFLYLNNN